MYNLSVKDTVLLDSYISFANKYFMEMPDTSFAYWAFAKKIIERNLKDKDRSDRGVKALIKRHAHIYLRSGHLNSVKTNYLIALKELNQGAKLFSEIGEQNGLSECEFYLGAVNKSMGRTKEAIAHYSQALAIVERCHDTHGVAIILNDLALILFENGETKQAFEYFKRGILLLEKVKDWHNLSISYHNLGKHSLLVNDSTGIKYLQRALEIEESNGDILSMMATTNAMASYYLDKGAYKKAYSLLKKSDSLSDHKRNIAADINNLLLFGKYYKLNGQIEESIKATEESVTLAKQYGLPALVNQASVQLYELFKFKGDYRKALQYFELHVATKDSLGNESIRKASIKSQLKYEYEKQAAADSVAHAKESEIKNVQLQKQNAEIKAKKNQQYALFGGLALVIIFSGFMYNRYKITQKQKEIIDGQKTLVEKQKHLVEEKQKEILDSIHYAKRIQTALIPSDKYIDKSLTKLQKRE